MQHGLRIETIESMPFGENTYVVWQDGMLQAVVIDPGLEPDKILDFLDQEKLEVVAILNTHGHGDHIGGNQAMKETFPNAPLIIGADETHLLNDPDANMSAPFGLPIVSPGADRVVREPESVEVAGLNFEVIDTPGHSPGHVVFLLRGSPCIVFGGDVLFREGIGRYDFPNSDGRKLFHSIKEKLYALPHDTVIYPGHGPTTTIGHERKYNPFVSG